MYPTELHQWLDQVVMVFSIFNIVLYVIGNICHAVYVKDWNKWTDGEFYRNWVLFTWVLTLFMVFMIGTKIPDPQHPWKEIVRSAGLGVVIVVTSVVWMVRKRKPRRRVSEGWNADLYQASLTYDDIPAIYGEGL
jgi:surface polysaccharide O-acyltransferase-like enzyme